MRRSVDSLAAVRRLRVGQRLAEVAAIILLVVLALLLTRSQAVSLNLGIGPIVVVAVLAVAAGVARVLLSDRFRIRRPAFDAAELPDDVDVDTIVIDCLERWDASGHSIAANGWSINVVVDPEILQSRISQAFELTDRRWAARVSRVISLPPGVSLIPIHSYPKGSLVGSFQATVDGERSATLQHDETQGFYLLAIDNLLIRAFGGGYLYEEVSARVFAGIVRTEPLAAPLRAQLIADLEARLASSRLSSGEQKVLLDLTRQLLINQYILAVIEEEKSARVARVDITYNLEIPSLYASALGRIRVGLGLGPRDFELPIPLSASAASYHLDVTGPEGTYVFRSTVIDPGGVLTGRRARSTRSSGDNRDHLYITRRPGETRPGGLASTPTYVMNFREVPPGLVGSVLVVSAWFAVLAWFVGIYHNDVFHSSGPASAWPALLFGVPAILTGWVVSRAGRESFGAVSIPSFLLMAWLAVNAAAVVIVAALKSAQIDNPPFLLRVPGFAPQLIAHPTWSLIMVSTGLCFFAALINYADKIAAYLRVVNSTALLAQVSR